MVEPGKRAKRVKVLTPEQKEAIRTLTHPSQMSHEERKRQFGALGRRLEKTDTLPPGVLAKWECAQSNQEKSETQVVVSQALSISNQLMYFFRLFIILSFATHHPGLIRNLGSNS